jgi:hypothetical protein
MIKKSLLILLILFSPVLSGGNQEDTSAINNIIIQKNLDQNHNITIRKNPSFEKEINLSITFQMNDKILWSQATQIPKNVELADIVQRDDETFFITGYKKFSSTEYDIYLMKFNQNSGKIWENVYSKPGIEIPNKITLTLEQNIIIGGYCAMNKDSYYAILTNDIHLLKVNSEGTRIWVKTLGLKKIDEEFLDMAVTDDNEILLIGKRKHFKDILYMAKINKFGNIGWQNTYEIGNYIKTAKFTNISDNSSISIKSKIYDLAFDTQKITKKDILISMNSDGAEIKTDELYTDYLDLPNDFNKPNQHTLRGVIRTNSVNLRKEPLLNSSVITNLTKGEIVEIIEKTDKKQKINNMNDYWYHLKVDDNKSGWIYGYFLDIVK